MLEGVTSFSSVVSAYSSVTGGTTVALLYCSLRAIKALLSVPMIEGSAAIVSDSWSMLLMPIKGVPCFSKYSNTCIKSAGDFWSCSTITSPLTELINSERSPVLPLDSSAAMLERASFIASISALALLEAIVLVPLRACSSTLAFFTVSEVLAFAVSSSRFLRIASLIISPFLVVYSACRLIKSLAPFSVNNVL